MYLYSVNGQYCNSLCCIFLWWLKCTLKKKMLSDHIVSTVQHSITLKRWIIHIEHVCFNHLDGILQKCTVQKVQNRNWLHELSPFLICAFVHLLKTCVYLCLRVENRIIYAEQKTCLQVQWSFLYFERIRNYWYACC